MLKFVLSICAMVGLAAVAYGDSGGVTLKSDEVIAAREAGFFLMGGVFGSLKPVVESGQDVKPYAGSAEAIAEWAAVIPTLFPPGTQTGNDTAAKPEIWTDRAGFEKAAANLKAAAIKLAELAKANDKAGFASQFEATAKACGDCHKAYRVKKD
jgi:cytochrome c556